MIGKLAKRVMVTAAVTVSVLGLGASAALAQATTDIQNLQLPVTSILPAVGGCANLNETINIAGTAHVIMRSVTDGAGGTHVESFRLNLQGVAGVGATSGAEYRVVRSDVGAPFNSNNGASMVTAITRSRIVTAGSDNDSYFDGIYHFTMEPDGDVHFFFEFVNSGCTGG